MKASQVLSTEHLGLLSGGASLVGLAGLSAFSLHSGGHALALSSGELSAALAVAGGVLALNGVAVAKLMQNHRRSLAEIEAVLAPEIAPQEADAERRQVASASRIKASLLNAGPDVERLTDFDPLTGLGNLRWFVIRAGHELKRVAREGGPIAMIALRVDHLAAIDERFGGDASETALLWLSDMLRNTVRSYDLIARIGPDEFCALLPGATQAVAATVAKRLKIAVEKAPQVLMQGRTLHIECVVVVPEPADGPDRLIAAARNELQKVDLVEPVLG